VVIALVVVLAAGIVFGYASRFPSPAVSHRQLIKVHVYFAQSTHVSLYLELQRSKDQLTGRLTVAYLAGREGRPLASIPALARSSYRLEVLQPVIFLGGVAGSHITLNPADPAGDRIDLVAAHGVDAVIATIRVLGVNLGRFKLLPVRSLSFAASLRGIERVAADLNSPNYPAFSSR
jgi:hypothetical protein